MRYGGLLVATGYERDLNWYFDDDASAADALLRVI